MEGQKESDKDGESVVKTAESSLGSFSDDSDIEMLDINTDNIDNPDVEEKMSQLEETCNYGVRSSAVPCTNIDKQDSEENMSQLGNDNLHTTAVSCANSVKSVGEGSIAVDKNFEKEGTCDQSVGYDDLGTTAVTSANSVKPAEECSLVIAENSAVEVSGKNDVHYDGITAAVSGASSNMTVSDGLLVDKVNSEKEVTSAKNVENDALVPTAVSCANNDMPAVDLSLDNRVNSEKEVSSDDIAADVNKDNSTVDSEVEASFETNDKINNDSANVENTVGKTIDKISDVDTQSSCAEDNIEESNTSYENKERTDVENNQQNINNITDINKESATVEKNVDHSDINKESVTVEKNVDHTDINKESVTVEKNVDHTDINKESVTVEKNVDHTDINKESVTVEKNVDHTDINKESVNVEKNVDHTDINKESVNVEKNVDHTDINKESVTVEKNVDHTDINKESVTVEKNVDHTDINKESVNVEKNVDHTDINKESVNVEKNVDHTDINKESVTVEKNDDHTDINKESVTVETKVDTSMDTSAGIDKASTIVENSVEEQMEINAGVEKENTYVEKADEPPMDTNVDKNKDSVNVENVVKQPTDNNADKNKESTTAVNDVETFMDTNDKVVDDGLPDISIMITDVRSLSDGTETNNKLEDHTVDSASPNVCAQNMETNVDNFVDENSAMSGSVNSRIDHTVHTMQLDTTQDVSVKAQNSRPGTNELVLSTDLSSLGIPDLLQTRPLSASLENSQIIQSSSNNAIATVPSQPSQNSNSFSAVSPLPIPEVNIISETSTTAIPPPMPSNASHPLIKPVVPNTSYRVSIPPALSMKSAANSSSKLASSISAMANEPSAPTIDLRDCASTYTSSVSALTCDPSVFTPYTISLVSTSSTSIEPSVLATTNSRLSSLLTRPVSLNYPPMTERTTSSAATSKLLPHVGTIYPLAADVVKIEPVDSDDNNPVQINPSADYMSAMVHKGRKLNTFTSKNIPPQKIVMTKVNKKNAPVTTNTASPRILPKRADSRRILQRQNVPISDAQRVKTNTPLNTNRFVLPVTASQSKASNAVPGKVDDGGEHSLNLKQMSTINIHSVGVPRITDLIARKNPLPAYKPQPVPIGMSMKVTLHTCYECGDSFHLAKSLQQHVGRCIMQINYNCETCGVRHTFTNKCQLLSHLRSHLNIDKSQAVPIHIKSDSIEIVSNYDEIIPGKPFEWFRASSGIVQTHNSLLLQTGSRAVSSASCGQCAAVFKDKKALIEHFEGNKTRHFFCPECTMHLNSSCAMAAHVALHKLADPSRLSGEEHWRLIKTLQCPECGLKFGEHAPKRTPIDKYIQEAVHHLGKECFHLSRLTGIECIRCGSICNGISGLQNHFQAYLEHYYKCELCPMALKSVKNVKAHFIQKHKPPNSSGVHVKAKVIYRCHACNTLIDDKAFLFQHLSMHVEEHKINTSVTFHCLQCGEIFQKKEELQKHTAESHLHVKRLFICSCKRSFASPLRYMEHVLDFSSKCHPVLTPTLDTRFCDQCGVVCVGAGALRSHSCLSLQEVVIIREISKQEEPKPPVQNPVATKNGIETNEEKTSPGGSESNSNTASGLPAHLSKTCVKCYVPFQNIDQREKHLRNHCKEKVYICIYCDYKNSKTYPELRSHEISCSAIRKMNSRQVVKPTKKVQVDTDEVQLIPKKTASKRAVREVKEYYMCEECSAIFTRKSQKEEHVKSEHGIHPCHLCGIVYDSQSCLKKHLSSDHERKLENFYCKICKGHNINKSFRNKETLLKHLKVKHRVKVCNDDNIISATDLPEFDKKSTPDAKRVKPTSGASPEVPIKKLRVEGDDVFKCAKCAYVSKSKDEFRQHILKHKASETCQCLECGLCFAVFPSLRKHVFIVHKIKDFDSYMKENSLEEPSMLEDIDVIREPSKPESDSEPSSNEEEEGGNSLECKVCYKQFDNMKNLVAHIRVHGMAFIRKNRRQTKSSKRKIDADEGEKVGAETDAAENEIASFKNKKIKTDSFSSTNDDSTVEKADGVSFEKGDTVLTESADEVLTEKPDTAVEEKFDETVGEKVNS